MPVTASAILPKLKSFIVNELLDGQETGLENNTPLLEWGVLDSLSMVSLLAFIEENLNIHVPSKEVKPENFENLEAISRLLINLSQEKEAQVEEKTPVAHTGTMVQVLASYGIRSDIVELPTSDNHVLRISGKTPTWILIPPLGNPSTSWGEMLRALINDQETVALDLVGFGLSAAYRTTPYTYEEHLQEEIQVLQKLGQKPIVLVCSSIGATLGTAIARLHPEWVKALVILGFGLIEEPESWWKELSKISNSLDEYINHTYYNPPTLAAPLKLLLTEAFKQPAYNSFFSNGTSFLRNIFNDVKVPTLFITGEEDRLIPKSAVTAAAAIVGGQVEWLARCGHFPQVERSQETLAIIQKFLKNL